MKYDFIAIISPHSFDSRDSNLTFREEFPAVRTWGVMFIPAIGVPGKDLFIDGIGLLVISLSLVLLTLFSAIGHITDCKWVEWQAFDVIAVSIGL